MIGLRANSDIAYESDKKSGYFHELWNLYIQIIEHQQAAAKPAGEKNSRDRGRVFFQAAHSPRKP
jgi:hypothetical protein